MHAQSIKPNRVERITSKQMLVLPPPLQPVGGRKHVRRGAVREQRDDSAAESRTESPLRPTEKRV